MRCANCDRLAAELAEAREEVGAWKAYAEGNRRDDISDQRLFRWAGRLRLSTGIAPRILIGLVDRAGRIVSRELVVALSRGPLLKDADDVGFNLASVYVCKLRHSLRDAARRGVIPVRFAAVDGGVRTAWGQGYVMDPDVAAALKAAMGEVAE